jgi:hypothetical protein
MLSRGGWALTGLAGLSVGLLGRSAATAVGDLDGPAFPDALLGLGCLVQLALSSWVLLAVALSSAHAPLPILRALTPRLLRRALFAGTASALIVSPVHADRVVAPSRPAIHDVVGLRLPDRPVAAASPNPERPEPVVVRAGDTLWAIAARSLPTGASDAEIARACARWHDANRGVIGTDPNLIFPTQRLVPPLGKDST